MTYTSLPAGFLEADGKIDYTFTNDYMFRTILQTNELALKGLISALLHIPLDKIQSVEIKNPIKLGETLSSKDFILDIQVLLNSNALINLEIQVENQHNWPDRLLLPLRFSNNCFLHENLLRKAENNSCHTFLRRLTASVRRLF